MFRAGVFLLLALGASGSKLTSKLQSDLAGLASDKEMKDKPIARVVNLLKDMKATLEEETKNDQELYDKLVCWCETNDKEKTKAIADGQIAIKELTATIEENSALASTREAEIGSLSRQQAALEKALSESSAIRSKDNEEFNQQEKDMTSGIASLGGAVKSIQEGTGGASASLLQLAGALRHNVHMAEEAVAPHQRAQVRALLLSPSRAMSLLQQPVAAESYAPQSGAIFGILKQMKETFETNQETNRKNEAQAAKDYGEMKTTKESQLKVTVDKLFEKTNEFKQARKVVGDSKSELEDTQATLAADQEFLAKLKKQCADIDAQWEVRSKTRAEELAAVGETILILTDDSNRDQFQAAGQFMQLRAESKHQVRQRDQTAEFLAAEGKRIQSPRISYLALRVKNDVFAKVKESIDGMVDVLDTEQHAEVDKKDGCVKDINENENQSTERNGHKEDVETEIHQLESDIKYLNEEEQRLKQGIKDAQVDMMQASLNRDQENKEFQTLISDQQACQDILEKAKARLAEFYANRGGALIQQQAGLKKAGLLARAGGRAQRQEPPVAFEDYSKSSQSGTGGAGGAMTIIDNIIHESEMTKAEALEAENTAQTAYEEFVKATNDQIAAMANQITNDEATEAQDAEKEVQDESDKRATVGDIIKLSEVSGTLHEACDFTVNNFDERQHKRGEEMEALKQSKSIFSGAGFGR